MKINNVYKVCDIFLPDEERPINKNFIFLGERFWICTYWFKRGKWGLQGNETPKGYFIDCSSDWLNFYIDVFPERGEYKIKCEIDKKFAKRLTAEERDEYIRKADEIKRAFIQAIVSPTNSDKIRSMTDEELARERVRGQCPPHRYHGYYECLNLTCEQCWLDWLKQEVDE